MEENLRENLFTSVSIWRYRRDTFEVPLDLH